MAGSEFTIHLVPTPCTKYIGTKLPPYGKENLCLEPSRRIRATVPWVFQHQQEVQKCACHPSLCIFPFHFDRLFTVEFPHNVVGILLPQAVRMMSLHHHLGAKYGCTINGAFCSSLDFPVDLLAVLITVENSCIYNQAAGWWPTHTGPFGPTRRR